MMGVALAGFTACVGSIGGGVKAVPRPVLDPDLVQRGGSLFLDPRISGPGRGTSCATCHAPNLSRRALFAAGQPAEPGGEGVRAAPLLRGLYQTKPYLWDGSLGTLQETITRMLAVEMGGGQLSDIDKRALEAYLLSIPPFDNQRVELDGTPVEPATKSANDGFLVFQKQCSTCHPPPVYSRSVFGLGFDVGTGGKFDVPTLRGLPKEGPYGHDGRWATLEDAMLAILKHRGVELTYRERYTLLEYLKLL